ncbi:EG45-like domain containing protein [Arachis hypogaea]|nr:EG45-like domain containing protein [Arachis hypogaea]
MKIMMCFDMLLGKSSASACYGYEDEGTMIAAAREGIYNNGGACGQMYKITCTGATNAGVTQPCTGASVTVKVVDLCPSPGCQGTFDLSQEAFSTIANINAGKVDIDCTPTTEY